MRSAEVSDLDPLAKLWYDGWQEAHAPILPPALARYRSLPSFRSRLEAELEAVRVMASLDGPLGFSFTKDEELYQLYVSGVARGGGVAIALLTDAEQRLAAHGVETAWLACAIGNHRAARFYEKNGWLRVDTVSYEIPTPDGIFPLEVWRYEKKL